MKRKQFFSKQEQMLDIFGIMNDFSSVFELTAESEVQDVDACKKDMGASSLCGETDYLKIGEKLMSLAKISQKKYKQYSPLAEQIADIDYSSKELHISEDILSLIAQIVRKQIRSMEQGCVKESEQVRRLKELTPHLTWELCTLEEMKKFEMKELFYLPSHRQADGIPYRQFFSRRVKTPKETEEVLYLSCPFIWPDTILCGLKEANLERKDMWLIHYKQVHLSDISMLIAYLIIVDMIWSLLESDERFSNIAYQRAIKLSNGLSTRRFRGRNSSSSKKDYLMTLPRQELHSGMTLFYLVFKSKASSFQEREKKLIAYFKQKHGVCLIPIHLDEEPQCACHEELLHFMENILPQGVWFGLQSIIYNTNNRLVGCYELIDELIKELGKLPYIGSYGFVTDGNLARFMLTDNLSKDFSTEDLTLLMQFMMRDNNSVSREQYWIVSDNSQYCNSELLSSFMELFFVAVKINHREINIIRQTRKLSEDYAKSFQTKKNIPKKIQKIMQESVLNERFGYIEYDEMCDVEKIAIINAQIMEFVSGFDVDMKNVSLRFRRLGNHNAGGLYYPFYKCICIDINSLSSFVHEFGHMLDYLHGELSNTQHHEDFAKMYQSYVELLDKKIQKDESVKNLLEKNGKVKYQYYTNETEVFARCFEMYMTGKVADNSLLKSESDYTEGLFRCVYHMENEEFLQLVDEYFSKQKFLEKFLERQQIVAA